ncbi:hypothetical protein BGZ54_004684 [Gamsiella multidivaricata]|nr:hypothetical protein BGZ54_004684 [Gamsiella multidivaricata]
MENSDDKTINVIKTGYLGTEEVLVTADESGDVCVWFTMNLQRDPLLLSVTESAWGIAIHAEQRLIAISSNAHTVTVFHCGIDSRPSQRLFSGYTEPSASGSNASSSSSSSTTGAMPALVDRTSQQILRGHGHNIPCVTFSPCGRFVATASVDQTCRTWRLSDGKQIQQKSLGPLWGWGVCFVDRDSWITISRTEYKMIPKDHLRPGKLPGQNVRDSPLSTTTFSQRRLPPGRDFRMIRSRWFAGPLHNTSCDEQESGDEADEDGHRWTRDGDLGDDNDDMDDRDAALFGMDDDEGEDEWEDMSSTDGDDDEGMESEEDVVDQRSAETAPPAQDAEISIDTGDDGDNEGAGADTEDGGGTTTEEGIAARSVTARSLKTERRTSVATVARAQFSHGESSSEQEQLRTTSSRSATSGPVAMPEPEIASGDLVHSEVEEVAINQDPNLFVSLIRTDQSIDGRSTYGQPSEIQPGVGLSAAAGQSPTLPPQYPSELLLCATARNIYLFSRHTPPDEPEDRTQGADTARDEASESAERFGTHNTEWMSMSIVQDNEDDGEEDIVPTLTDLAAHGDYLDWHHDEEGAESEYDPDYDTDPYYEDMDDFMGTADEDSVEDEGNSDEDEDMSDLLGFQHQHSRRGNNNANNNNQPPTVPLLHTLSVARAAAARADGRRFHHLEHYDRLFVMLLVPELSVLVAASQKGSVTIFRLLRVLDDLPPPLPPHSPPPVTASSSSSRERVMAVEIPSMTRRHREEATRERHASPNRADGEKDKNVAGSKDSDDKKRGSKVEKDSESAGTQQPATIVTQGAKYVLFPEMYLPRLEPPPFPLLGISVVPIQRSSCPSPWSTGSTSGFVGMNPTSSPLSSSRSACSTTSPGASFMLHMVYIDSQFYSYEIRLRNEKDDPVGLSNVFV